MAAANIKAFKTYRPESSLVSPRQTPLRVKDIDDYPSLFPRTDDSRNRSKAVASAMRSLQDKIRHLEEENEKLRYSYKELEDQFSIDKERWQKRLALEVEAVKDRQKEVTSRDVAMSAELKRAQADAQEYREKLQIAEGRVRVLEAENKRIGEQAAIDRENANLQLVSSQRKLEALEDEVRELRHTNSRLKSAQAVHSEEVLQAEHLIASLKDELGYLREHNELQRSNLQGSLASTEAQLAKQYAEYEQQLRQLEVRNQSLHELSENHKRQLEYIKNELAEMHKARDNADETQAKLLRQNYRAEAIAKDAMSLSGQLAETIKAHKYRAKPKKTLKRSGSVGKPAAPKARAETTSETARPQTSRTRESTDVDWEVRRLEESIASLNKQYRQLLSNSYSSPTDLRSLRLELNALASALEDQSNALYSLKRQQQSALKARIST